MKILLANPRGFCAGVRMAIRSLELVLESFGPPVYVFHQIVHNRLVVEEFESRGAVFVDALEEIPVGSIVVYSAHGVSPQIRQHAAQRRLRAIDVTCPLVAKVHIEAIRFAHEGYRIVLIGHARHDEVVGTMGEAPTQITLVERLEDVDRLTFPPETKLAYLTQTTLSVDDTARIIARLVERYPTIEGPAKDDICYATQNRQHAVRHLARQTDLVLVIGSRNSSNSQRLADLAIDLQTPAHLIDSTCDLRDEWLHQQQTILITAGASAPESAVEEVVRYLQTRFDADVEEVQLRAEDQVFPLPIEVRELNRFSAGTR